MDLYPQAFELRHSLDLAVHCSNDVHAIYVSLLLERRPRKIDFKGSRLTTSMRSERTLRQVLLPSVVQDGVKDYAQRHRKQLQEVYDEAILYFLKVKKDFGDSLFYFVSPTHPRFGTTNKSMWISSRVVEKVATLAEKDTIPENRIIFTALVYFLQHHNYLTLPTTR